MALTPCPECEKQISTDAKTCPHCGKKAPNRKSVTCLGVLIAFIVGGIFMIPTFFFSSSEHSAPKKPAYGFISEGDALGICQEQIEKMAKYSSSVEFSYLDYNVHQDKKGTVIVVQNFTAMNSFGAKIPQQGTCRIRKNGQVQVNIQDH